MNKIDIAVILTHLSSIFYECTVKYLNELDYSGQLMFEISVDTTERTEIVSPYACSIGGFRIKPEKRGSFSIKAVLFVQPEAYMDHYKIAADNG